MITVDIGCGGKSRGYVNIDRYYADESPDTAQHIAPHLIKNFVLSDICNLPLRDDSVDVTVYHVIEHILEVNTAIKEIHRVCKNKAVIVVPNHPVVKEHYTHLYSWSKTSLQSYLSHYFPDVSVNIRTLKYFKQIHKIVSLIPVFFIRRRIYQTITAFIGFELVAVCKKASNLKEVKIIE